MTTTTKIGRPPIGPAVQVRLSPELLAQLDAYAAVEGVSRAEAIRRIIYQAMGAKRMSAITALHTNELREGDTLLVGASMVSVDSVEPDEISDYHYWLHATCISGNFDQWDTPHRAPVDAVWSVLNAAAR